MQGKCDFSLLSNSFEIVRRTEIVSYLARFDGRSTIRRVAVADLSNKKSGVYKENREKRKDDVHPAEVEGRQLVTPTLVRRAESALYLDRRR